MEKPRYSRISDIIELLVWMLQTPEGVTIKQIQQRFNVSRRTAERLKDALICILPQIDVIEMPFQREKHWGFIKYSIPELTR